MPEELWGRQAELALLKQFIEGTVGHRAFILYGEPGIGKTRLCQESIERARTMGTTVLTCHAVQSEARLSFAGLTDLVAPVIEECLPALLAPQRTALAVATLREVVGDTPVDQRTVATGVLSMLRYLGKRCAVLVAIDDLQWLDAPSRRALTFAVRRLNEQDPVRLLATVRIDEQHRGPPIEMPPEQVEHLNLGPLDASALRGLLISRLGMLPRPPLMQIVRVSAGNPLLALELGGALREHGPRLAPGEPLPVPQTLSELVLGRVRSLPGSTRKALLGLAAMSRPNSQALREAFGDRAVRAIEPAIAAGVLEEHADEVQFQHPLVASAVYTSASSRQRRAVHHRLALVTPDPEERARHLALATTGPDPEIAVALGEGARLAHARGAPQAAAELAELAAERTPKDRQEELGARLVEAGRYWFEAGDLDRAVTQYQAGADLASEGDRRAEALLRLGETRYNQADFPGAAVILHRALENAHSVPIRALTLQALSMSELNGGSPVSALRRAEEALALADRAEDPGTYACVLTNWIAMGSMFGREVRDEQLREAIALDELTWHLPFERRPGLTVPTALKFMDRFDEARAIFGEQEALLVARGEEISLPVLYYSWSELEVWAGHYDLAKNLADRAYGAADEQGLGTMRCYCLYPTALLAAISGDVDRARGVGEEAVAQGVDAGAALVLMMHAGTQAFLDLSLGDPVSAHQRLQPIVQILLATGMVEGSPLRVIPDEIEALIALGELGSARELLDPFERRATAVDRIWARAAALRCRGLLVAAGGDLEKALTHAKEAVAHGTRIEQPFELGRTLLVTGTIERRLKRRGQARRTLAEALALFERLGAPLWAQKARAELARIGGRAPVPLDLTPTERRIAELVTEGRSNKEVATELFVTVSTVEANLWKIFRKLNIRSRTELARWVTKTSGPQPSQ